MNDKTVSSNDSSLSRHGSGGEGVRRWRWRHSRGCQGWAEGSGGCWQRQSEQGGTCGDRETYVEGMKALREGVASRERKGDRPLGNSFGRIGGRGDGRIGVGGTEMAGGLMRRG